MNRNKRIEEVKKLLQVKIGGGNWLFTKPKHGVSKESYIAESKTRKIFIKFDVNIPPLLRLGEMGLAPKVIGHGKIRNKNFIIQEFIEGLKPDNVWVQNHLLEFAEFIKKYHSDEELKNMLNVSGFSLIRQINNDMIDIERQLKHVKYGIFKTPAFNSAFLEFKKQSKYMTEVLPVVVHADPNLSNLIIAGDSIYMVDWDNILLSDPIRDLGLILWWYVPRDKWKIFFDYYGIPENQEILDRLFWWVAARSLAISLWWLNNKKYEDGAKDYLEDFYKGVEKRENINI